VGAIANAAAKVKPKIDLTGEIGGFTSGRMSRRPENPPAKAPPGSGQGREARLAQALRANLRRRKAAPDNVPEADRDSVTPPTDE